MLAKGGDKESTGKASQLVGTRDRTLARRIEAKTPIDCDVSTTQVQRATAQPTRTARDDAAKSGIVDAEKAKADAGGKRYRQQQASSSQSEKGHGAGYT
jgi:hypothetical protein